jgi:hypothetical protein
MFGAASIESAAESVVTASAASAVESNGTSTVAAMSGAATQQ